MQESKVWLRAEREKEEIKGKVRKERNCRNERVLKKLCVWNWSSCERKEKEEMPVKKMARRERERERERERKRARERREWMRKSKGNFKNKQKENYVKERILEQNRKDSSTNRKDFLYKYSDLWIKKKTLPE